MSSRDQPFSDRASTFWGHHRLLVEQLTGVTGQRQLGLQRALLHAFGTAKDVAAGAVLVCAIAAALIGTATLLPYLGTAAPICGDVVP